MENVELPIRRIPEVFSVVLLVAISVSYVIATVMGQVYPFLPSISRTAAFEPGGSLFSLLLSFVILSALALVSTRFLQARAVGTKPTSNAAAWMDFNATSLLFGVLMIFGIAVVASFRCPLAKVARCCLSLRSKPNTPLILSLPPLILIDLLLHC